MDADGTPFCRLDGVVIPLKNVLTLTGESVPVSCKAMSMHQRVLLDAGLFEVDTEGNVEQIE